MSVGFSGCGTNGGSVFGKLFQSIDLKNIICCTSFDDGRLFGSIVSSCSTASIASAESGSSA